MQVFLLEQVEDCNEPVHGIFVLLEGPLVLRMLEGSQKVEDWRPA